MTRLHYGLPLLLVLTASCTQREPAMEAMDYEVEAGQDQASQAPLEESAVATRSAPAAEPTADNELGALGYIEMEDAEAAPISGKRDRSVAKPSVAANAMPRRAPPAAPEPVQVAVKPMDGATTEAAAPSEQRASGESAALADLGTESYVHYGVNDMTLADKDRFSTFAVDVDTASYAISRRKLQSGLLPPTSAVRVEEFVNAFHYDYPAPVAGSNDGAPFAVHMEAAPSPFDSTHHVLRVGVQGLELDMDDRLPMHLTFLVDTSGSMSSADKIGLAKASLHTLVENLQPNDTVALVTYAGSTQVVLEPTPVSAQRELHDAIDRLSTGGGTHMSTGMVLAYDLASQTAVFGHENRVVVLSDGDANIGRTNHEDILATVGQFAEEGITLSTIGFGMGNYKDVMMEQLANQGDGNYAYIDSQAEADKVFGSDMAGTMLTIAKDVKLQVEFNPEAVIAYRLIGYENRDIADRDFRNDRVDAGEIGSGHSVTALYDVVLRKDAASQELATVRVRAKTPGVDSAAKEWATVFDGSLLHDEFSQASKDLQMAFSVATFAELLRGSPYVVEVSYYELFALANRASRGVEEDKELLMLIDTAGQLSGERSPMVRR